MKEFDIIQGCKTGNSLAQKYFVEYYSPQIFNICKRYMKSDDIARDCLQETLIQVLKNIKKYEERGTFNAWLSSVTVRVCLSQLRKEKRYRFSELTVSHEPSVEEEANFKLDFEDVMKFLETVPEQYRVVINMYLVEGYSHKEIAEFLGVNESTSRSILSRARKMINDAFKDDSIVVIHNAKKKEKIIS